MTSVTNPRAVILLSGGLDSYTTAAIAKSQGFISYGLTISYGQRHRTEIDCAYQVAKQLDLAEHKVLELDLRAIGGSALTDHIDVPKIIGCESTNDIPVTYVPARNTIMLSLALGWAEVLGAFEIFIGANAVDYSGYPDCRPDFMVAFERLANLATRAGDEKRGHFTIRTPLIDLTKAQIIRQGLALGCDYRLTHSCYDPDTEGRACGQCDSCRLRLKGFADAGMVDPVVYV
jgi:7-cyano-7-deazaguanine synthase